MIRITDAWRSRVDAALLLPHYKKASKRRLERGLLAELAVGYALEQLDGTRARWLGEKPAVHHLPDLVWHDLHIDVKLVSRDPHPLQLKVGAESFHHVFVVWHHRGGIEIIGLLPAHPPETFEPAKPLENAVTHEQYSRLTNHEKAVNGWSIPRARLVPLEAILSFI